MRNHYYNNYIRMLDIDLQISTTLRTVEYADKANSEG